MSSFNKLQKTTIKNLLKAKNSYERKIMVLEIKRTAYNDMMDNEIASLQAVVQSTITTICATGDNLPFKEIINIIEVGEPIIAEEAIMEETSIPAGTEIITELSVESTPITEEDAMRLAENRSVLVNTEITPTEVPETEVATPVEEIDQF